jgi:hypothetical protein
LTAFCEIQSDDWKLAYSIDKNGKVFICLEEESLPQEEDKALAVKIDIGSIIEEINDKRAKKLGITRNELLERLKETELAEENEIDEWKY